MREKFTVLFILFLSILCKAQNSDVQNLTKEVRSIMYSDPKKALETADYILSIQNSISKSEIYEALLLQAELYVNLREYNLALLKLISANKISQEVSNPFLKCKAEYILAQIYLKLEFKENYNRSLAQLKQYAKKLKDQQQTTVINYITELNLISRHQENKFNSFSKESRKDDTYRNALDPTYKIRSHIIELSINQSPLTINDSLRYFQFLYALKKIEFEINAGRLNEKFIKDLQEKYPEYNAGLFYLYIYKKWSEKECLNSSIKCFQVRNEYLRILKLSLADRQDARVNIINLNDQIEQNQIVTQKEINSRIILVISLLFITAIIAAIIYYFVIKNKFSIASILLEKENLSKEYEEKLSNQSKNHKDKILFSIPEKTENEILAKLEIFENSDEMRNANLTLAILAKKMNTNSKYLSEIINKNKGVSFSIYLNKLRINYIVEKLKNHPEYLQYKTSYLAEEAGFLSRTTFATIFKKITGQSPSEFIEQIKLE